MTTIRFPFPHRNTFVLNHNGDDERWSAFLARNSWVERCEQLVRVPLINPRFVTPPSHWRGDHSDWARTRGLLALTETCLNRRVPSGMVVEDDMSLVDGGVAKFDSFAGEVPHDWNYLVFGGRHIDLAHGVPTPVSENVYRPFSISGADAFAWRTYPALRKMYDHYLALSAPSALPLEFFADSRHTLRCCYVPGEWLCVRETTMATKPTVGAAEICSRKNSRPMVAVLGAYRGGTSCVAGALHHLGVSMGNDLARPDSINPTGYFECKRLLQLCKHVFDHPSLARRVPDQQITGLLRQWAYQHSIATNQSDVLGAKHPALCCLGNEILQAWGDVKFVVVDRPASQIVESILRTSWGWSREEASINVQVLLEQRNRFLERCDESSYRRVDLEAFCSDPSKQVNRLREWLSLDVCDEQIQAAIEHVRWPPP